MAYLGLYALQHRGQESAGIASTDGHAFHVEKAMGWVADVFSRERLKRLPGHRAHRARALLDGRQLQSAQRPAHHRQHGAWPRGHRPQRQPRQRRGAAPGAGARRRGLPVLVGHRGHPAPAGACRRRHARRPARPGADAGQGRLHPAPPHAGQHHRRPRSLGVPPADARAPRRHLAAGLGDLRARPHGGAVGARHRAGRDRRHRRARPVARSGPSAPPRICSACSSTSTSRARTRCSGGATSTGCARRWGTSSRASTRWRRTSSSPCRTPGWARRSAFPRSRGSRTTRARPQPLRGPDLHRAAAGHPPLRRQGQAQPQPRGARRPPRGGRGRFHRARHHEPQDREDGAGGGGAGGAHAHLVAAHPVALLLRDRHADAQGADRVEPSRGTRSSAISAPTRSATSRSTGCSRPPAPIPSISVTPASRASTRWGSTRSERAQLRLFDS